MGRDSFYANVADVGVIQEIEFCIDHVKQWAKEEHVDTPLLMGPATSKIKPEPLGVVCIYGTWNFPFLLSLSPLCNAISAGNCVFLKPSEVAPHCSEVMVKVIRESLDQRFFKIIEGKSKVAITLNALRFDLFFFTGSTQKGKLVAQGAAKNLVPCILELGGKSPAVVDKDADIAFAAKKLLVGKLANNGQVCIAPDYVLCHESKVEGLVKGIAE